MKEPSCAWDADSAESRRSEQEPRIAAADAAGDPVGSRARPLPNLFAIVSVCSDWGIGRAGSMVVRNRADMRRFVDRTRGHAVIMGRRTLESLPGGAPLTDRRNIVLTRSGTFERAGVEVVHTIAEAIAAIRDEDEAWLIGGGEVYRQLLSRCSRALVTKTVCTRPCDVYFPDLDKDPAWVLEREEEPAIVRADEGDEGLRYTFATYKRGTR